MFQCGCNDWRDYTDVERANMMARYEFDVEDGEKVGVVEEAAQDLDGQSGEGGDDGQS